MNKSTASSLLKVTSILWIIWGLVHVLAGVMTVGHIMGGSTSNAIIGIADKVDPDTLQMDYPAAAGAVIGQHGFNLLWIGIITFICAFYIWKKNSSAIWLAALIGGLADLGYFLFMDLGGFVNFIPGTLMTIVSYSAIIISLVVYFKTDRLSSLRE